MTELLFCTWFLNNENVSIGSKVVILSWHSFSMLLVFSWTFNKLLKFDGKYAIQGEVYGPKVNGNPLNVPELQFVLFTIKNIKENYYLDFDEMTKVCKELDIPMVEVIEEGTFNYKTIEELLEKSKGNYPGTNGPREGLVYRLKKDWNKDGKRCSFKVINDDYLIKTKKK